MVCDRAGSLQQCLSSCPSSVTSEAYVFIRKSGAAGLGHVGLGFLVAPSLYIYGGLENPFNGKVNPGDNNGFWIRNGTYNNMLCDMENPPVPNVPPYDTNYKKYTSQETPHICDAVAQAESIYGQGYNLIQFGNAAGNCLDAVYLILTSYGVDGMQNPSNVPAPNNWYAKLDASTWALTSFSTPSNCVSRNVNCVDVVVS